MKRNVPIRKAARWGLVAALLAGMSIPLLTPVPAGANGSGATVIDMTGKQLDFTTGQMGVYGVAVGAAHRFENVLTVGSTVVTAVVTVSAATNSYLLGTQTAGVDSVDGGWYADSDVLLTTFLENDGPAPTSVTYDVAFVDQNGAPVTLQNLSVNVYDLDELQFLEVEGIREFRLSNGSILRPSLSGGAVRFAELADISTFEYAPQRTAYTRGRVEVVYAAASTVSLTFGDMDGGGYYEFDFSSGVSWESNGVDVKGPLGDPSAPVAPSVPCSQVGTVAAGDVVTCTLAVGQSVRYLAEAGHGGDGGAGGAGTDGAQAIMADCTVVPGGAGGPGGPGGAGGLGAAIQGTYTNTTGAPVTLLVMAGAHGEDGEDGASYQENSLRPRDVCDPADGPFPGFDGENGYEGYDGEPSGLWVFSGGQAVSIATAQGGLPGSGGTGGTGGEIGLANGTAGAPGAPGEAGADGAAGGTDPDPLPAGVSRVTHSGDPRVVLSAGSGPTLPPPPPPPSGVSPSTTASPTTTAPATSATTPSSSTVPAPVPDGEALPTMEPGASQVFENGVPTNVQLFVDDETDLVLRGQDFELRLAGQCSGGCTIDTSANGREVLTLERNGRANVGGEGFLPGTPVYIWLFSEPRFLGELTVNADGTFTGSVSLEGIEVGEHTLQVNGTSFDGVPRTANLGVIVNPAGRPTPGGQLPNTGGDAPSLLLVALALMGIGAIAVTRRPRRS